MNGGLQELDESAYWLDLIVYARFNETAEVQELCRETEELIRIFVACIKNAKDVEQP
jgi:four helix bundle protein